jgi:DNA-binding transcriptional ArsR family regulator
MSEIDIKKLETAASKLRLVAHPMRIAIIELLKEVPQLTVTEIYKKLKLEQAETSHHLTLLKSSGILASKREGKQSLYYLKRESFQYLIECIDKCSEM